LHSKNREFEVFRLTFKQREHVMKKFSFGNITKDMPINRIRKKAKSDKTENLSDEKIDEVLSETLDKDDVVAGRAIYDEIYGRTQQQISRLWKSLFVLGVALIIAITWLGILGNSTKVDLVVVHENGNNQIISVNRASSLDHRLAYPEFITYFLERFVKNARTVSVDGILQSHMMINAMSFTQGQATKALSDFYQERDPEELLKTKFIEVKITRVIPNVGGSDKTTQINWTETIRNNATNEILSVRKFAGQFTFRLTLEPPKIERIMIYNPMGFYITHISWAADYQTDSNS
jgi:type IV secretory pathway TrbF-like protein